MPPVSVNFEELKSKVSYNVQLKMYDIMIPILSGIIIGLNFMVVCSSGLILQKRLQSRSTYIFLGNIALADMMTGVATIFGQYYPRHSELVCYVEIGLITSATLASVYSIALIAVDRFLYILYGMQYQRYLSSPRARLMVIASWVVGGIVGFLPAMGVRNATDCDHCWLILLEPTALVLATSTVGVIPLLVILILYGIILRRALKKISEMQHSTMAVIVPVAFPEGSTHQPHLRYFRGGGATGTNRSSDAGNMRGKIERSNIISEQADIVDEVLRTRRSFLNCYQRSSSISISAVYTPTRWKAIKIVTFTTGCFFVTWFPYFLACALYAFCDSAQTPSYCNALRVAIASPLAILGLLNSLLNPIIYAWWHNGFRESVKKMYYDVWRLRIRPKLNSIRHNAKAQTASTKKTRSEESLQTGLALPSQSSDSNVTENR